jgi:hypothetical protein
MAAWTPSELNRIPLRKCIAHPRVGTTIARSRVASNGQAATKQLDNNGPTQPIP